jgi:hypothetical protein
MALHNLHCFANANEDEIEAAIYFKTELIEESLTLENPSEVSDEEDLAAKLQKGRERQEAYLRQIHQTESSSTELTCVLETNADFFPSTVEANEAVDQTTQTIHNEVLAVVTNKDQTKKTKRPASDTESEEDDDESAKNKSTKRIRSI